MMGVFRHVPAAFVLIALAACATTSEPGWTGKDAVPFDKAMNQCRAEFAAIVEEATREAKLAECMERKGWTRPVA